MTTLSQIQDARRETMLRELMSRHEEQEPSNPAKETTLMKTTITVESSPLPLADGTYQLPQDTPNPKPDGRIKTERASNWESWTVWPEGMRFIIETIDGVNRVYPYGAYSRLNAHDPRVVVLLQELELVDETPSEFLERKSSGSGAGQLALAVLDKLGISLSDIQAALDALDGEENASDAA